MVVIVFVGIDIYEWEENRIDGLSEQIQCGDRGLNTPNQPQHGGVRQLLAASWAGLRHRKKTKCICLKVAGFVHES